MELHAKVSAAVAGIRHEVMACDAELADTAAFCAHYGVALEDSANTILIASKRPEGVHAVCVALAHTRLDVNRKVRQEMGVKKLSFADAGTTIAVSGMEIGGVTPFGLDPRLPVLIDSLVMTRPRIILGGGNRTSKLVVAPEALLQIPSARVVSGLAAS